ncbi:hypothetical protein HH303_19725 [Rhodospirillaceae bacterium KN72]|uniref:Uncharacterized protein n=1 Tax=Pacificispira spongiicola TaxID=2729598 RepID=A0A7Y0E3Y9_9PROT|nr:hypothetical protein [Pacificispira spongiicola]NMM46728.1 hypothetical protein [Pacificispira spongiicola]
MAKQPAVSTQPRVRFLLPVWGERYIERFAELCLPSLLAPGNLPALTEICNCEFVLLTTADAMPIFEQQKNFDRFQSLAPTRILPIDDLIVNEYSGVTLSHAYFRGVADAGEDMVDIHFLFLNSDIILSDGSLASVAQRIVAGERCILANSIRAISEALEAPLKAMIDDDKRTLAVSSRDLVSMALQSLHPTLVAKLVNDDFCHSIHVNQLYWRVDSNTLVSRHFLYFMLSIRPEKVVVSNRGFCDYFFVPEMCPTTPSTVLGDSDEFFALEIQYRDSEADFLRLGRPTDQEVVDSLAKWTTETHRRDARDHVLIFHSQDLPPDTERFVADSRTFVGGLIGKMPPPQPHIDHPYWTGSQALWEACRQKAARRGSNEDSVEKHGSRSEQNSEPHQETMRQRVGRHVLGRVPELPRWHPDWLDYRLLAPVLAGIRRTPGETVIYVDDGLGLLASALGTVDHISIDDLLSDRGEDETLSARYRAAVVEMTRFPPLRIVAVVEALSTRMDEEREIILFWKDMADTELDTSTGVMSVVGDFWPGIDYDLEFWFAGGRTKRSLKHDLVTARGLFLKYGKVALPLVGMLTLWTLFRAWGFNRQAAIRQDSRTTVESLSSFTFHLKG